MEIVFACLILVSSWQDKPSTVKLAAEPLLFVNPVAPNPLLGVGLHAIGALFAATCYTPQKKVNGWSWQTYWITQASFCWFLLPIIGAWLTIPDLSGGVARGADQRDAQFVPAGRGLRHWRDGLWHFDPLHRFSLTYAIAVGLSSVLGTLIPPLVKGTLADVLHKAGAGWVMAGIAVGALGIACAGWAGWLKEKDLTAQKNRGDFSLMKGLLLSLLAGVLSAVYGFALEAGAPIADVASAHGAGVFRGNVVYIFSNTGAFLTTAIYCLWLHARHRTIGELVELPAGSEKNALPVNFVMAAVTGLLWYGQFFFYNLGHVGLVRNLRSRAGRFT